MAAGRSSTGISPRPMLMGVPRNALRAFNAGVSLSCLRVLAHRLPHLFCGLMFVALLFGRGPVLRTCNRVMAHRPTGSTQTDRIRLPYAAPEASRRAFFVKVLPSATKERNRERVSCFRFQTGFVNSCRQWNE